MSSKSEHMSVCSSNHSVGPWTEEPILGGEHLNFGLLMVLPVGCTDMAENKPVPH